MRLIFLLRKRLLLLSILISFIFSFQLSAIDITIPNETGPLLGIYVNTYTGNLFYQHDLLSLPGRGISLEIIFFYNSGRSVNNWGTGNGWSSVLTMHYTIVSDSVFVNQPDGQKHKYIDTGTEYTPPAGIYSSLTEYETDKFCLKTKHGIEYYFDDSSHKSITSIVDRNGNTVQFNYTGAQITGITDASGRNITLTWSNGLLSGITDPNSTAQKNYNFQYDGEGNLLSITGPMDNTKIFTYGNTSETWHPVQSITNAIGTTVNITYNANNAVESITCPAANTSKSFEYVIAGNTTTVTETATSGNRVTDYIFDTQGRVIEKEFADNKLILYEWDTDNNITSITDRNNNVTVYTYDNNGNQLTITDPLGNVETYAYGNEFNFPDSYTDKNGNLTTYTYDNNGNLLTVTDPLGNTITNVYDASGNRTSGTDKNGNTTTFTYDNNGYLLTDTDPLGNTTTYTYDAAGNRVSGTDANGNTTTYEYDNLNRVISKNDALGNSNTYVYDMVGNLTGETDKNANVTNYSYDDLNRLVNIIDALEGVSHYTFDEPGNLTSETDTRGNIITYVYDLVGNLVSITDASSNLEAYTYDGNGNRLSVTDKNGNTTTYTYDGLDRLLTEIDPFSNTITYVYDNEGNLISETDKNGNETTYTYDGLNRLITLIDPLDNTEVYTYDNVGNMVSETDKNENTTTYTYDNLNRLVQMQDPHGLTEGYTYDPIGNRIGMTDKNGGVFTYSYDDLNRLIQQTDPRAKTEGFTYDAVGNQLSYTNKNDCVFLYTYDALNRLTRETDPLGFFIDYSYDPLGNLISETDKNGNVSTYSYDPLNRLVQVEDALNFTEGYSYDPVGNLISETDKNGNVFNYFYDDLNRLTTSNDPLANSIIYNYDPLGNRISETDKNGNTTQYTYDGLNRVIQLQDPLSFTEIYTYDPMGNTLSQTDKNGNVYTYTYDDLNRLITQTGPLGGVKNFTYSPLGNLLTETDENNNATTYTYDWKYMASSTTPLGNLVEYVYDGEGNLIEITDARDAVTLYAYDCMGRLILQTDALTNVSSYSYDPAGNRISATDPNNHTTIYEYDSRNNLVSSTTPMGNQTIFEYDGNGNVIEEINPDGTVIQNEFNEVNLLAERNYVDDQNIESYSYDAVGNLIQVSNTGGLDDNIIKTYDARNNITSVTNDYGGLFTKTLTYEYDGNENRTSLWVEQDKTTYTYDAENHLTRIKNSLNEIIDQEYDAAGRKILRVFPYSMYATYEYDDDNNLLELIYYNSSDQVIASFIYTYDENGNVIFTDEFTPFGFMQATYEYDALNRLIEEDHGSVPGMPENAAIFEINKEKSSTASFNLGYAYDPAGNRILKTGTYGTLNSTYDSDNKLLTFGNNSYTWDENGNLKTMVTTGGPTNYTHNSQNRLTNVDLPGSDEVSYDYSANWQQVIRTASPPTVSINDDNSGSWEKNAIRFMLGYIGEADENGNAQKTITKAAVNDPICVHDGDYTYQYVTDQFYNIRLIFCQFLELWNGYYFSYFGEPFAAIEGVNNNFMFAGWQYDHLSHFYGFYGLNFNPSTGQYMSNYGYPGYNIVQTRYGSFYVNKIFTPYYERANSGRGVIHLGIPNNRNTYWRQFPSRSWIQNNKVVPPLPPITDPDRSIDIGWPPGSSARNNLSNSNTWAYVTPGAASIPRTYVLRYKGTTIQVPNQNSTSCGNKWYIYGTRWGDYSRMAVDKEIRGSNNKGEISNYISMSINTKESYGNIDEWYEESDQWAPESTGVPTTGQTPSSKWLKITNDISWDESPDCCDVPPSDYYCQSPNSNYFYGSRISNYLTGQGSGPGTIKTSGRFNLKWIKDLPAISWQSNGEYLRKVRNLSGNNSALPPSSPIETVYQINLLNNRINPCSLTGSTSTIKIQFSLPCGRMYKTLFFSNSRNGSNAETIITLNPNIITENP